MQLTLGLEGIIFLPEFQGFVFPLYFLDYETYMSAIPMYEGYKPQQHTVFQYSLHIMSEDGSIEHREYLGDAIKDPRQDLVEQMVQNL